MGGEGGGGAGVSGGRGGGGAGRLGGEGGGNFALHATPNEIKIRMVMWVQQAPAEWRWFNRVIRREWDSHAATNSCFCVGGPS